MSREKARDDLQAERWLQESHMLPPLEDLSLEGRSAFLEQHEDILWDFWSKAFSVAIASESIDPRRALGARANEPEPSAREIADKLIMALHERSRMDRANAWGNLEGWYAWLIGGAAARAGRRLPVRVQAEGHSGDVPEELLDLQRMLARWRQVLERLVERTGIRAIELDWLWATYQVRKQLTETLGQSTETSRLVSADLQTAIAGSSSPGQSQADRIARTRSGAAACFRFNVEELASRGSSPSPLLAMARTVFVGPARSKPPYPPQILIDTAAVTAFEEVWHLARERVRPSPEDGHVERLWKGVFRCGLNKAALRLLPRKMEEALRGALPEPDGTPIENRRDES
ncbi:hypothetical protein [Corallococcus llansteffanensis]|nr:hypothetical protein [Corallococcus llansteffanensis]